MRDKNFALDQRICWVVAVRDNALARFLDTQDARASLPCQPRCAGRISISRRALSRGAAGEPNRVKA